MRTIFICILISLHIFSYSQEAEKITLKPVVVNAKEFKKQEVLLGLKKKSNSKFLPKPSNNLALKIENKSEKPGKISSIILYLHKTSEDDYLANLEIKFYTIHPTTGFPDKEIDHPRIIYTPKNRRKGKKTIDIEKHNITFPKEGVFLAVSWLTDSIKDVNQPIGPTIRTTSYSNKYLTFHKWKSSPWYPLKMNNKYNNTKINLLAGLTVWVRK